MLERVRSRMEEERIKTLVVTDEFDFRYVFGLELSGYAFITQEEVNMVLPRFYRYEDLEYDADFVFSKEDYEQAFDTIDSSKVYMGEPEKLENNFDTEKTSIITDMRKKKTPNELQKLRKAAEITDQAIENIRSQMIGMTEFEAVNEINRFYSEKGVEEAFLTDEGMSLVQRNSLRPHRPPKQEKIGEDDLVIVDTGARFEGYCGDVTRTFCQNPDEKQQKLFDAVKEIQEELIEMIEPGLEISKWKEKEFELVEEHGYDPEKHVLYFGHNIGVEVHEPPTLSHTTDEEFEEGMVVTVEPGLHVEGIGGVRIEDMVYVNEEGAETLSSAPREL